MVMATLLAGFVHLRRRYDVAQANTICDLVVFAAIIPRLRGPRAADLHECISELYGTTFGKSLDHSFVRLTAKLERAASMFADQAFRHRARTQVFILRAVVLG
jgi:hypothetical protein